IRELHRLTVEESTAHREVAEGWPREEAAHGVRFLGRHVVDGHQVKEAAIEPRYRAELRLAEPCRAGDDGVEHRLNVGRRPRDDTQDLARRRLLLERLGQITVPRL